MVETLRKKAKKSNIQRVIFSVIGVIILLAVTKFAVFDVITGPAKMDITADPAAYDGRYVTIDVQNFLYDYIEHKTTTTRKYGGSTTSVNGYSYLVFQSVADYENQESIWYFYSIYLNKSRQSEMDLKIQQTFDYLNDETGTVAPPDPVTVTGVWNKMDSQTERYFRSALSELGITESDIDRFYLYELDTKNIGGLNAPLFWVLMACAAFLVLFAVLSAIGLFSNAYMKNIQNFLQQNGSVSLAEIEEDFNQSHPISKHVWLGKKWTVYMSGNKAKIINNKDIVWGYYYSRTGRNSVSEMRLFSKSKNMTCISLSEKDTQTALKFYAAEQPQMVVGYGADLEKMYNKDFNSFLELKYNPAMREF